MSLEFWRHWVYNDFYSPIWPNIVASMLVAGFVEFRLRAHRKWIAIQHESHHKKTREMILNAIQDRKER